MFMKCNYFWKQNKTAVNIPCRHGVLFTKLGGMHLLKQKQHNDVAMRLSLGT